MIDESEASVDAMGSRRVVGIDTDHGVRESGVAKSVHGVSDEGRRDTASAVRGESAERADPRFAMAADLVVGGVSPREQNGDDLTRGCITRDGGEVGSGAVPVHHLLPTVRCGGDRSPVISERTVLHLEGGE